MHLFFLFFTLPFIFANPTCRPNFARHDCGIGDQQSCINAGCCWTPVTETVVGQSGTPWCYKPQSINKGYTVTSSQSTSNGKKLTLSLAGGDAYWGPDITHLNVDVIYQDVDTIRVIIRDADKPRWEIPTSILPPPPSTNPSPSSLQYTFTYTNNPFGFAITRISDGVVLFNTTPPIVNDELPYNALTYTDQYLEITTQIPIDPHIYGLGEHVGPLHLAADGKKITMWARDAGDPVGQNIYGTHPFYIEMRDGVTHGVFLRNSNGMDVVINPKSLQYRVIGGILDFTIFVGGTPEQTIQQYHRVIGTPHMPPFWALGWHQCRWGYKNLDEVKTVVAKYAENKIPLDTMWTDIDYMNAYEDFSTDPKHFPTSDMSAFINTLHNQGQHYVLIIDPAIHQRVGYASYDSGIQQDVFVKKADGNVFIGKVWPGLTAFPSFFKNQTLSWWQSQIKTFLDAVPVDGLWIDMNEPSNFCDGACTSTSSHTHTHKNLGFNPNDPPYRIHNANTGAPLNVKTIDPDAKYGDDPNLIGYNVHNLYGMSESIATQQALETIRPIRSLVISRSTYAGQGHHAGHWLGDNVSTWESMWLALPGILAMNLFGIPLVGADICGFNGATTEELCVRWSAVGAFYPFARNHNSIDEPSQEPYVWDSVASISRKVLAARYSLLPYYNTLFAYVHMNGGTVARPLFFEFPADSETWKIDTQFLIGPGLLISPVLTQGANSVNIYLPSSAVWYDFWTNKSVTTTGHINVQAGWDIIPVHLRGGFIYAMQTPGMTTTEQRSHPYELRVALDSSSNAQGSLFIDDGEDLNVGKNAIGLFYQATPNNLVGYVTQNTYTPDYDLTLSTITILGVQYNITQVIVNNNHVNYTYDNNIEVLILTNINIPLVQPLKVMWN